MDDGGLDEISDEPPAVPEQPQQEGGQP
jgi:hypothetical protein